MKLPSEKEYELLALVVAHRLSGREVAKCYQERTGKSIAYGTLYTTFRRLQENGWVTANDDQDKDGRVRYFRITAQGREVLEACRSKYESLAAFGLQGGVA